MNASTSITSSSPSNPISSSCRIPSSSLPTISNTFTPSQEREQEPMSLTKVEEEQPIPPSPLRDTSSSSHTATTTVIEDTPSTEPTPTNTSNSSVMVKMNNQVSATQCSNCGTTTTPLWRRAPNGDTICNACGLYLKARHTYRPTTMKRNTQPKKVHHHGNSDATNDSENGGLASGTCPGGGKCNGTGGSSSCAGCPAFNQHQVHRHTSLMCANCRTTTTPLWRRDGDGNTICNACGLYYKLHNVHRPVSMKRSVIKRRKRLIVTAGDGGTGGSVDGNTSDGEEFDQLEHDDDEEHQSQIHRQRQQSIDHTDQQHQQEGNQPDGKKKPRKPYRKRVKPQEIDALGKNKRNRTTGAATSVNQHSPTSASISSVPAIEDYIVPKRTIFPHGSATSMASFSAPVSPSSLASSSLSSSSSFPSPSSASSTPSLSALMQTDPRQQQQQYSSTTSRLTTSIRNDDKASSSLSLPPISSERRSAQLNPFYRDNGPTTTASLPPSSLPPFSLPPLRPTATTPVTTTSAQNSNSSSPPLIHHPSPLHPNTASVNRGSSNNNGTSPSPDPSSSSAFMPTIPTSTGFTTTKNDYLADFYLQQQQKQQQQQSDPEFMELEDLDEALKSLKSLRRKVQPEHVRALAQLSKPLWDMVSKAQSIVHGTGALSQP